MKPIYLVILLPALLVVPACQPSTVVVGGQMKLADSDSAAYLDRTSSQPTVTEAQALNGLLLMLGEKADMSFEQAVALVKQRKIADACWDFQADRPVTRGRVAYMIYQACRLPGGLTLTLTGPSQRYCLRELQYQGFMSQGLPYNTVTGLEYVSVLTRADEYRQTGKVSEVLAPGPGEE